MNREKREKPMETIKKAFSLSADKASNEEIRGRLLDGGQVTGTNMCVLVCAMVIASAGLNTNSTAVIIGAMLISPLMGSILASAYASVTADYPLLRKHLIGFLMQIAISVIASTLYFFLSPVKEATSELLARTGPTFFDVIIAFWGHSKNLWDLTLYLFHGPLDDEPPTAWIYGSGRRGTPAVSLRHSGIASHAVAHRQEAFAA